VGVRGPNPTAPMVREANRGAVIPTAGGERGLGQGWVYGGQIPPLRPSFAPNPMWLCWRIKIMAALPLMRPWVFCMGDCPTRCEHA
jgi:hypothetical protein